MSTRLWHWPRPSASPVKSLAWLLPADVTINPAKAPALTTHGVSQTKNLSAIGEDRLYPSSLHRGLEPT